jgi:hypothetical protein
MRKLLTAVSFAALALAGIGTGIGITQSGAQLAELKYDFPTNAQEDDVNIRDIAQVDINELNDRYIESPEHDGDDSHRQIAEIEYDFPRPEQDGDDGHNIRTPGSSRA